MRRRELIDQIRTLGRAFVERDMTSQARRLRVYYLALTHGLTEGRHLLDVHWTEDFVAEWLRLLDLEPYRGSYERRVHGQRCPRCPVEHQAFDARHAAPLTSVRTMVVFPGGAKMQCLKCGFAWVAVSSFAAQPPQGS